ncbi:hypothetical protein QBC44DRAFT_56001 [Cladorrhinum sp. PSN332]|nr:hypothetical protein QBC44DRAFT_56001 [Cladorrhinum sp. PSN332]
MWTLFLFCVVWFLPQTASSWQYTTPSNGYRPNRHKVALAGGSGQLGRTIIDGLIAANQQDIVILSRRDPNTDETLPGVSWNKVDYENKTDLVRALRGVDTVLSFIIVHTDPNDIAQQNLIDASVEAGVNRFAPSEWSAADVSLLPWYSGKAKIREYLKNLNKKKRVLEYTLFQPGLILDYYTFPHVWHKHIKPLQIPIDFGLRRALLVDGTRDRITFTTVHDVVKIVTQALNYKGTWPTVGGIRGNLPISASQLVAIGNRPRGPQEFVVERLQSEDLQAGEVKSSWIPQPNHTSASNMTQEERDAFGRVITRGVLLSFASGAFSVTGEWNRLFPGTRFGETEEFLSWFWRGRP